MTARREYNPGTAQQHRDALVPGARIGQYEIVTRLGAGGMGEVYRARDARLQRDVAIKSVRDVRGARLCLVVKNWFDEVRRLPPGWR